MKTILITGIGGLTPRSIATIIRENHPDYKLIGCDTEKKAMGFFMKTKDGRKLIDKYYIAPRCDSSEYFPFIERIADENNVDYAFVQPESEIVEWGQYFEDHGKFPVPVFMGCKLLSESLRDKSIMAELLEGTEFIPKTIKVTQESPRFEDVETEIGFPCWIRATEGTGGLGSLRLDDISSYKSWLFINARIPEFTVSEFLTGRHLANEMLYYNGEYVKGAALECAEYVMANTAPSHVTGNTHFGRFLNEDRINVVYPETARIQGMLKNGMKKPQACAETGMAISTLNSFLPYEKGVYNLADVSTYAESSRLYRERKEAVLTLQSAPSSLNLWKTLIVFAGYPFVTSGRGEKGGVKFKYSVSAEVGAGGKHYDGTSVDGFGNELWIVKNGQRAEKSISRYSVDYALKIAIETQEHAGQITGPKQLKIYGASYIFALFRRFGLV